MQLGFRGPMADDGDKESR